ncbi:Ribonucleases P/MRP protein subunit POP1 [Acropora cervicornis]|uniref:Ribonucleases P/MRP protein subunit POP1 n=1 Tax=Acropora cervicornis TaxID=6130 RepID=A0AAD9V1Z1_ACRCE|nr:Ribonucleases P/MRP protein subunit POP1 [Acropora cervicornis]
MASGDSSRNVADSKACRKRKRPCIPGFTSSVKSTPSIFSQAPRGINVAEFAEARALEISNMVEALKAADRSSGKRLFQTLPRHMRRRSVSFNLKRMPVRLRYRASLEKKSRRTRRKPRNLLEEYNRRQRKHVWLETHIWHAKRMKMVDAWGYRLADHPTDKGFRACYRAMKNHCFLQDISYYGCIEVCGAQGKIIQAMNHLTNQDAGLTVGAKCYLNGTRQGHVVLYQPGQYPHGALAPVSFLWRQQKTTETCTSTDTEREQQNVDNCSATTKPNQEIGKGGENSQLWVWAHPAGFQLVFDAIAEACSHVGKTSVTRDCKLIVASKSDAVDKADVSECHGEGNLQNPTAGGIEQVELSVASRRFDLVRFRLTGPQSHALLASTFTVSAKVDPSDKVNEKSSKRRRGNKDKSKPSSSNWWCNDKVGAANALWENLRQVSSPSVLPQKEISHLDVPEMMTTQESFEDILTNWPTDVAGSLVWDEQVRRKVKETKITEHELNRKRSELLLPGSRLTLSENETSHIPLLLVQQPGCLGNGWDIIMPSGWAMSFWVALVYRGARTGGLQEAQTIALEQGVPFFPNDFPDTPAGEEYLAKIKKDGAAEYKKRPPAKRPNYSKLGNEFPFSPPWKLLVEEWSSTEPESSKKRKNMKQRTEANTTSHSPSANVVENESSQVAGPVVSSQALCVLRSLSNLTILRNCATRYQQKGGGKQLKMNDKLKSDDAELTSVVKSNPNTLVFVFLRMVGRSVPEPNSVVAIPSDEDSSAFEASNTFAGPVEPRHTCSNAKSRKTLRNSCTREIMGFVSSGHYSLSRGYGVGVAFCTLPGLVKLLSCSRSKAGPVVLVRSPGTQQYRFAFLSIL